MAVAGMHRSAGLAVSGGGGTPSFMGGLVPVYPNEVQTLTVSAGAAADTFDLTFNAHESATAVTVPAGGIEDITAAQVQACIDSISDFSSTQPVVSGDDGGPFAILFSNEDHKGTNVGAITVTSKTGAADGSVAETQRGGTWFTDELPTLIAVTGGAANTKGSYATLAHSISGDASMLKLSVIDTGQSGQAIAQLMDIAKGAASSESVIIPNILTAAGTQGGSGVLANAGGFPMLWFPVDLAEGDRVAAAVQDAVGADTAGVAIELFGGGAVPGGIDTMGAATASSSGVEVLAGNNAFGNWVEIEDSTTATYRAVTASAAFSSDNSVTAQDCLMQVGVGASGSESVIAEWRYASSSAEALNHFEPMPTGPVVPTGSRLAVRCFGGGTGDTIDVVLHGVK